MLSLHQRNVNSKAGKIRVHPPPPSNLRPINPTVENGAQAQNPQSKKANCLIIRQSALETFWSTRRRTA
ncbi:MAG: hypothetical protein IPL27_02540 [Lewinellaceae bacterium]|nr:hypothetical protein [Lewinellaceae bacterium]